MTTIETKTYPDGTTATGPAPLPDASPSAADRELLELAAKAAGKVIYAWETHIGPLVEFDGPWNPLEDDGDALRLAVALAMTIEVQFYGVVVKVRSIEVAEMGYKHEFATRRAIVRAAAEIGRSKP